MADVKYISLPQLTTVISDVTTKADSRFLKNADKGALATKDEVAYSDLASALQERISSLETTASGLGAVAVLDEIAESNLASALATKINGKADAADLGDVAALDSIAEENLATALATKINGKADTSSLGDLAVLDEVAESNLASALATKINGKADTSSLGALATKSTVEKTDLSAGLQSSIDAADAAAPQATTYTKTEVDNLVAANISSAYKAAGSVAFASLPTPAASNLGNVYNVTNAFTPTSANFVDYVAGSNFPAGTNVVVVEATAADNSDPENPVAATYKFDVLQGWVDLSNYATIDVATQSANGLMSSTDKTKLDEILTASSEDITTLTGSYWAS